MLRLTTLGAIDLRDHRGHPVRDLLAQPKRVALLAYLALESRRGPVTRDRLLAFFWPESDAARARNALSQALHHLRLAIGAEVIESHGANALAVRGEELWCDAVAFTDAVDRGEVELALDLYRGEFCPGLFSRGSPDLDQWFDAERRYLRARALAAARTLAQQLVAGNDPTAAGRVARRALAMQPDDEGDVRALLAVLEQAGDRGGALLAYQEYARRLAVELETRPAPQTQRLADAMRQRHDQIPTIPEADPGPAPIIARPVTRAPLRRRWAVLVTLVGVALFSAGFAISLGTRRRHPAASQVRTLVVFPFTLRGGAPFTYLRDGMVDLMSAKLEGALGIHAIDPRSVLAAVAGQDGEVPGVEVSARIARDLGAAWYISGDVLEVAGRLQLSGTLVDAGNGSRTLATATVSGDSSALFELVDQLAGRMLAMISTTGRDTTLTRLAAVTTHSLPALRRFLDGERELREGRDAQAAAAFRDAAMLDTSFALAQYRLAVTATWVNVPDAESPVQWAATAARHAGHLTPLARDLLTAYRAYKELRSPEAERLYRALTEAYPDNVEAWFMLGETLFHYNPWRGRSPMEAWSPFQKVLALDPTNSHAMIHLARLAAAGGRTADLDSLVRRYLERYSDAERALEMRALRAYVFDDAGERRAVAAQARDADDYVLISLVQAAMLYAQNVEGVRDLARPFGGSNGRSANRVVAWRYFSELPLVGGQWNQAPELMGQVPGTFDGDGWRLEAKALLAVEPLLRVPPARVVALRDSIAARRPYPSFGFPQVTPVPDLGSIMQSYLLGLLSARLGDTVAATRYAAELAAVRGGEEARPASDLARGLRAEIARVKGNLKQALVELQGFQFEVASPGVQSLSHWGLHERFLMAELLHALGRDEEALPWYDSFQGIYDPPYLAVAHLRMGEIFQALGDRERADFHFGRLLSIWHDADAEWQPLLATARRSIASLP